MAEIKFSTGSGGNNNMNIDGKKAGRYTVIICIIIALVILLFNSITIIHPGHIGVKIRLGTIVQSNLEEGLHLKIPFIEEIRPITIQNLYFSWSGDAYTRDSQQVNNLHLKLTYSYSPAALERLMREVGISNIESTYLFPQVQSVAKDEIGRFNAERLVQSRSEVQSNIQDRLTTILYDYGILVHEFAIENIAFEQRFLDAVQAKVVAAQEIEQMEHQTERRRVEAEQIEITAKAEAFRITTEATAEAEAIRLIQEQIAQNREYIEYLKIIQWNGILPQVIGDGVNPFVVLGADNIPAGNNRPATQSE